MRCVQSLHRARVWGPKDGSGHLFSNAHVTIPGVVDYASASSAPHAPHRLDANALKRDKSRVPAGYAANERARGGAEPGLSALLALVVGDVAAVVGALSSFKISIAFLPMRSVSSDAS